MEKKRSSKKLGASVLAILLVISMMVGMVPGGMSEVHAADAKANVKAEEQTGFLDKAKDFFSDMGEGIASFFTGGRAEAESAAALAETSIVDKETSQGWRGIVENTTQNIGRIWTDKSVYNSNVTLPGIGEGGQEISITKPETSDFMVGLSALSSTSNTSVITSTPLDIVLVLDVSGSMKKTLGTTYAATYNIETSVHSSKEYYVLNEKNEYVKVEKIIKWFNKFVRWELNGVPVEPKTDSDDNNSNHIQFYELQTISKMNGLKTAVNGFIDATAEQNATITDPDKQHHISVVKYADDSYYKGNQDSVGNNIQNNDYNYSQIVRNLTENMDSLKTAVNNLDPGGATSADYGMNLANRVLDNTAGHGVRKNTKKVIVLFTDGEPNHSNGFSGTVANDAIASAKTLKDNGALVYSIGVVSGADPEDTSKNINAYLHGISSNYPKATGYQSLGDRAANSNYYKAATNSEELNNIFKEISQEINSGTGYPTDTEEGFENRDGYVTFHDQLGDYMQVDSFNTLVLNDERFENPDKTESKGNIKYTYSGEIDLNGDGKSESVSDIVITVTPGTGSMGDTVEVSIPATLLPLRNFKVDITEKTMTVEDKYPLRLFYNVSLKEGVKKSLVNPDQEMKNYIAANSEAGNVYFYSNKFTGSKQGPTEGTTLGDTTATFEPASGNSFYYFTENTPLWLDEQMKEPVTAYNANREVYYYEKTYYKLENGAPKEVTEAVSFRSHPQDEVRDWVDTATDGQLYIKAGAPRLTRIHDLTDSKETPVPGTATEVITPDWDDMQNQRFIEVSLGNNGRLAVELPGTLEIKKMVTSEVDAPEKAFNFKLSLKNADDADLTGEFDAQKFDETGIESGDAIKVHNGEMITLKHGDSIKIYGLSDGDKYTIEETEIPEGFTAANNSITGAIVGNEIATEEFVNTYAVQPAVLEGDSSIRAQKVLKGRDWEEGDSFKFVLRPVEGDVPPLPEVGDGTTVEGNDMTKVVTDGEVFSFGKMTFTKPGTYKYVIFEVNPGFEDALPGVSYSRARYRVDIEVTDNGKGQLSATSTMLKRADDLGQEIQGDVIVDDQIAVLTNTFEAESVLWGVRGNKVYTDNSGANPLKKDMFEFQIETVVNDEYKEAGPLLNGKGSNALSGQINFGSVECGSEHKGKKYLYKITEIVPEGVTSKNPTKDGMTYDTRAYYLEVLFDSKVNLGRTNIMTATSKYFDEKMEPIPNMTEFVFENEYTPKPVIIGEGADTAIKGSKTLNGRAMNADEFSFELTAGNDAAVKGLADDSIVFGEDNESVSLTAKAPATENGAKADFNFGKITFTKPGTYTFNMKEVVPKSETGGMTYDTHTEVVTVTVKDNLGVLEAQTTYDTDGAAFVNTYKASHNYADDGGALVTKTLNGRDMKVNEFQFTITGTGDNAEAADKKLAEADKAFKNYAQKDGVASEMPKLQNLQFTEKDAGKTFTYLIDEVMPEDADRAGGVTYDQSEFTLAIEVTDNGNGTMSTTTTVTRIKAIDGTVLNDVLGEYTDAAKVVAVPFVNTYKAESVSVDTTAETRLRKVLRGRDWTEKDSFTFTMTPQGDVPMPAADPDKGIKKDENGNLQAVVTAKAGTKAGEMVFFGFGSITYDKAGIYEYTVTENEPESPAGGMTYSKNVVTITIRITDPGTGKLEKYVDVNGTINNRTFYNDYAASLNHNDAGGIVTQKTLMGHALAKDQFTFQVKALDGTNTTADENAKRIGITNGTSAEYKNIADEDNDGTVVMKTQDDHAIVFTSGDIGKTFKYQFSEKGANGEFGAGGEKAGYTYDDIVYTVELKVTDDLDGTLTLHTKVTGKDGSVISEETSNETDKKEIVLAFNNSYAATGALEGNIALEVTKNLTGRKWIESDSFSFKLEATGETAQAVVAGIVTLPGNADELVINGADENKKASFGSIGFTKPGTYTFKVTEVVPEKAKDNVLNGITYDSSVKNIIVNVTDNNDGKLIAVVAEESDALTFTNTYGAGTGDKDIAAQIEANKILHGRKMSAKEFDFEVVTRVAKDTGVFKEEVVAKGTNAAAEEDAEGKVTFAGAREKESRPLTYTTESLNQAVTDGYAVKDVVDGKSVWTMNYTARELTEDLPTGVKADKTSFDFTIVVTDDKGGTLKVAVQYPENGIVFENSYATGGTEVDTDPIETNAYFNKVLTGRNWLESDAFTFTIEPQNGAPTPEKTTVTVTSKEAKAEESVPFGFGKIRFTDADMEGATLNADGTLSKTFTYEIRENDIDATEMPGVTKDSHKATLIITVTDNQKGELSATAGAVTVENGTFTNKYTSGLDYNALGGLQITKVLHGRDMEAGQFTFTVTPQDADSAKKLGFEEVKAYEFKNKAAEAEAVDTIDVLEGKSVTFTQADAGKTFTYTVVETKGENIVYTYDVTPRTVTIEVVDNNNATLTVTTTVTKDGQDVDEQKVTNGEAGKKATVAFENTYNDKPATLGGEGNVTIRATKSLTNRPLENGEFTFNVYDKNGDKVTTGKNNTDGTITFGEVKYTTDKLIADVKKGVASVNKDNAPAYVYTYEYEIVEASTTDGVTGITTSFRITVLVTDDGNGELKIEVVYPEGKDPLPFENAYGTSANAEVNVNGQKNYVKESGNNAPDITGKYRFTISGSEGAPMPEKTEVTNDRTGNVDFGKIHFTMENVFGKDTVTEEVTKDADDEIMPVKSQERKKTYTYTVKESGSVPGVDNDSKATKTFTVTVTDNGDGTISVEKSWEKFAFEFTNTYRVDSVDYDMNADLTVKKELSGRKMKKGEFTFELVDSDNQVVATATNKADGTVTFDKALNYKEPGVYNYVIREQQGTAGGVQYDSAEYAVTVVVTDNGDGTLNAKAETKSRGEIVFKNIYETTSASVTLGAFKVYEGNELKDEQFTFVLKDKDGKVVSKAKNTANGQVAFGTIIYDEEGTYEYTISEKNDKQKNVTYDEAVYKVTVTVTDNGEGSLLAEVAYTDGKAPVFTNKYTKPAEPQKPAEPHKPAPPKTGAEAPIIELVVLMVIALAAITTVSIILFKKRKRG